MAFVLAIHDIEDCERFWRAASASQSLPELRLHRIYPLVNGTKAVSLWEGASADSVGDAVDALVGDLNHAEFYEVDPASALGLPDAACEHTSSIELERRSR